MDAVTKLQILIIDDDAVVRNYVSRALKPAYSIVCANNGEEGLLKAADQNPDLILLDVEMDGINGYEVCDRLKSESTTKNIPVIFMSSHGTLRKRMLGYEAGAMDYLVKPFDKDELIAKLKVIGLAQVQQRDLEDKNQMASQTAMQAMQGSSELGRLINFIDSTYTMKDFGSLAQCLLQAMGSFNLNCCVYMRASGEELFYSQEGDVKPLEKELIVLLSKTDKRFQDFGCRTQINYANVSLLIKNMPLEDRDTYGRYKDMVPHIVCAVDTQIKNIITHSTMASQTENLAVSFALVNETLSGLAERLQENENTCLGVMREMVEELDQRVPGMGLEDDQEAYLMTLIDRAMSRVIDVMDDSGVLRSAYEGVMCHLKQIGDQQRSIAEDIRLLHEEKHEDRDGGEDGQVEIELF
ncbi:MAG: response regulator transcription factor [Pseudomonadales bacterium]|nr:response regulator transcription factor [Pseudomonadales bacterium]